MKNENNEALHASTPAKIARVLFDNEQSVHFPYESRIELLREIWDFSSYQNNCEFSCKEIVLADGTSYCGSWDYFFHVHFDHGDYKLTADDLLNLVFKKEDAR